MVRFILIVDLIAGSRYPIGCNTMLTDQQLLSNTEYSKRVILELDKQLTFKEALVLIVHTESHEIFSIIDNFYDCNRSVSECADAILKLRLTLLQVCPCKVCEQLRLI